MVREKAFGRWTLLSVAVAAGLGVPSAFAQDPQADGVNVEELTVTGTRIRRSDYTSPTPDDHRRRRVPARPRPGQRRRSADAEPDQRVAVPGGDHRQRLVLRRHHDGEPARLEPVLRHAHVDARRFDAPRARRTRAAASISNFIPSVIIDRMETVTGGASASYGSDAVTGVVNILLDKDFTGLKLETRLRRERRRRRRQPRFRARGGQGALRRPRPRRRRLRVPGPEQHRQLLHGARLVPRRPEHLRQLDDRDRDDQRADRVRADHRRASRTASS